MSPNEFLDFFKEKLSSQFILDTEGSGGILYKFNVAMSTKVKKTSDEESYTIYDFAISTIPPRSDEEVFEFSVAVFSDGKIRVNAMNNNGLADYSRKGIAPAMIAKVSELFQRPLQSSTNEKAYQRLATEWQSTETKSVWKRLVSDRKATFDSVSGLFEYSYPPKSDQPRSQV